MSLHVVCAGYMVRSPLGGLLFHHLQYLVGLKRLGHRVTFVEHFGWPDSCYDPVAGTVSDDPKAGLEVVAPLLESHGLGDDWCYCAADGTRHGLTADELTQRCRDADLLLNLSNVNWIDDFRLCRRLALVDTDPVFTQIGGLGIGGQFDRYDALFTYGENVHREGCGMPTGGARWLPTRQPVVLDLWPVRPPEPDAPITSVVSWSAYGERTHEGKVYGQKDRQFEPFMDLPRRTDNDFLLATNAPGDVKRRLRQGGWGLVDPQITTGTMNDYQMFLASSRAEFCVAKHAYVVTGSGWFSDRSAGYLASGRPVILEDTGFSRNLPCGQGLLAFRTPAEAERRIVQLRREYPAHAAAARALVKNHFSHKHVLSDLLARAL